MLDARLLLDLNTCRAEPRDGEVTLVQSHLHMAYSIPTEPTHRHSIGPAERTPMNSGYPSEPLLAEAAAGGMERLWAARVGRHLATKPGRRGAGHPWASRSAYPQRCHQTRRRRRAFCAAATHAGARRRRRVAAAPALTSQPRRPAGLLPQGAVRRRAVGAGLGAAGRTTASARGSRTRSGTQTSAPRTSSAGTDGACAAIVRAMAVQQSARKAINIVIPGVPAQTNGVALVVDSGFGRDRAWAARGRRRSDNPVPLRADDDGGDPPAA